jgi:hypothetical protein
MLRKMSLGLVVVVISLLAVVPAFAQAPNFGAGLWADDARWGTKAVTALPSNAPAHSFDKFLFIVGAPAGAQDAPVMEAAPGNTDYNGGRWVTHQVTVLDPGEIEWPLTSYEEVMNEVDEGNLIVSVEPVSDGVHPLYFECPLLPYK